MRNNTDLPDDVSVIDTVASSLKELFIIRNPEYKVSRVSEKEVEQRMQEFLEEYNHTETVFVYYPWKKTAVRMVGEEVYFELRTARNKHLITQKEQLAFRNGSIGIVGLSVGASILRAIVLLGGSRQIKLSDNDTVAVSNLNRLDVSLCDIGENKAKVMARRLWELDPFLNLEVLSDGVAKETLSDFLLNPRIDVFIDEMDDLELKIYARQVCQKHGIPVVMATDNEDSVILDVERFDQEPERKILHGFVEDLPLEKMENLSSADWLEFSGRIIGEKNISHRMQESIREIGKTVTGVPQLGSTAMLAGAVTCFAVRKILTSSFASGRYIVNLEESLVKG